MHNGIGKEKSREQIYADEFTSVLNDSGYFSILEPGNDGDIRIQAVLLVSYSGNAVRLGTGLSFLPLSVLPSWGTVIYKATVNVTAGDGKNHDYILDDVATRVIWFPMIFVTPFKKSSEVSSNVRKNIYKNLLLKMQQDGVLI